MGNDTGTQLWKEWFRFSGEPWITDDYGHTDCFFCTGDFPNHLDGCVFVKAQKLIKESEDG